MKSMPFVFGAILVFASACSHSPSKVVKTQKYQEVVFSESEVPYIQTVKKDGKVSAIIVTPPQGQKN
jgi:hypothetical protein